MIKRTILYLAVLLGQLVLSIEVSRSLAHDEISPEITNNSHPTNPGMFVRLMPTGLAYLREAGAKVVNEEVPKLTLPTIMEIVEVGELSISRATVTKYWAPEEYDLDLVRPNTFTWSMSKMHVRAMGDFVARLQGAFPLPSVPIQGQFEALLSNIGITTSVRMTRNRLGAPQVESVHCKSEIGFVDLEIGKTGLITDLLINTFKAFLITHFKPRVEQRMCIMIQDIINQDTNRILSTMPLKIRISDNELDIIGEKFHVTRRKSTSQGGQQERDNTLINFVNGLRDKDLVLDYGLLGDPLISKRAIAIKAKGEISWRGTGGTPFSPPSFLISTPHGTHMIEFYGTDYIFNSLLYHAYKQRYMDLTISPESSTHLKNVLQTTCATGFCIGETLGALGEQYPNREVEVHFTTTKVPYMIFSENSTRIHLHGEADLYLRPQIRSRSKQQVLKTNLTMTSDVRLWVNGTRVVGNSTLEKLEFKLIETTIEDVDQSAVGDLGFLGTEFLENLFTEALQVGIVMPSIKGVVLKNPKLSIHDRHMIVRSYFTLNEKYAGRIIHGAVKQTLSSGG
ncbi:hypothetical protein QR680_014689 [Steinernema hermaphroditum]|uniref:Lipid-binding serum glycoprotein C-terminal domain-containing protein n=1 Tax=Steinernema hermaphroditum TaxID=289476 RepID=A0AA39IBA2_9BILA|nr:hypothetical protein QR680_014689 [Steinernema hermaphroditum]